MQVRDTVVIGGGVAGCTAAMYATRYGLDAALVEMLAPGGQATTATTIENYPGFPHISGAELSVKFAEHAQSYDLEMLSDEVVAVGAAPLTLPERTPPSPRPAVLPLLTARISII